ncbi:MAG: site-specific DNA-methyltransferase [Candidatus Marinimicrobia bacterium]|nr:site-specific DNA-methyltransferase [Candidatus Neomarinimicrobiota bacterium]
MIPINEIIHGDAYDLMPEIEPESVELIFTDPPYEQSLREIYADWNHGLDWNRLASEFDRILKPSGQVAMFCDWTTGQILSTVLMPKFRFRFLWIWRKPNGQPVGKKQPINEVELIIVYSKRKSRIGNLTFNWKEISTVGGEPYRRKFSRNNQTRKPIKPYVSESSGKRYPKQILDFPTKCNLPGTERTDHPTQKPVGLCGYVVKALSNIGDLVCDPFAGSGSIPIACHRLNRRFVAFERDPEYYRMASERLRNERAQGNLFGREPKMPTDRPNEPFDGLESIKMGLYQPAEIMVKK